ncbi:MAG: tetratricopeptide repeat protein [Bdellovibrionales bacterium]|nr:tetratricopeptide repeat protein [Bdellovibrionales bacterium]
MLRTLKVLITTLTVCSLIACSSLNESQRANKSELHTRIGTGLLSNNKLPQAIGEFRTAIELDPTNHVAHNNLALAYFLRGKTELAKTHLKKALKLKPSYTEARNNLGRVYVELKQYETAIQILEKAQEDLVYPFPAKILTNLGYAYLEYGRLLKAQQLLKQAVDLNRSSCLATNLWAKTYYKQANFYQAAIGFDQAIQVCKPSAFAEPQYLSGVSYFKVGRREMARTRFQELLKEYPVGPFHGDASKMLSQHWPKKKRSKLQR